MGRVSGEVGEEWVKRVHGGEAGEVGEEGEWRGG